MAIENECSFYDPSCGLEWLSDEFKSLGLWAYDKIISGFAYLFEIIPMPAFMQDVGTYTIPSSISWAASMFDIPFGIGVMVTAYIIRFVIRRLPFIG